MASQLAAILGKCIDGQHGRCDIIDQDQYRRLVGQCFIGDVDIGLAMVKAGLAEAMLRYLPATHSISEVEYGQAENRARDNGFGMWSAEIESPHVCRRSKSSGTDCGRPLGRATYLLRAARRVAGTAIDAPRPRTDPCSWKRMVDQGDFHRRDSARECRRMGEALCKAACSFLQHLKTEEASCWRLP